MRLFNKPEKPQIDEGYWKAIKELDAAQTPLEYRTVHKKLKKYKSGVPMFLRYPDLPFCVGTVVTIIILTETMIILMLR